MQSLKRSIKSQHPCMESLTWHRTACWRVCCRTAPSSEPLQPALAQAEWAAPTEPEDHETPRNTGGPGMLPGRVYGQHSATATSHRRIKKTFFFLSMRIKLKVHDTKWKSDINRGNKCGFIHLVVKQVPESVYEAGEELCVTKQSAHKPRGPWALSKDANN